MNDPLLLQCMAQFSHNGEGSRHAALVLDPPMFPGSLSQRVFHPLREAAFESPASPHHWHLTPAGASASRGLRLLGVPLDEDGTIPCVAFVLETRRAALTGGRNEGGLRAGQRLMERFSMRRIRFLRDGVKLHGGSSQTSMVVHAKLFRLWKTLDRPPAIAAKVARMMNFATELANAGLVRIMQQTDRRKQAAMLMSEVLGAISRVAAKSPAEVSNAAASTLEWSRHSSVGRLAYEQAIIAPGGRHDQAAPDYEVWVDAHEEGIKAYRWIHVRSRELEDAYQQLFQDDSAGGF